jgi:RNA polymerase sigma-70 factor, ECF subfamily
VLETERTTQQEPARGILVDRSVELELLVSRDLSRFYWKAYQQLGNIHDAEDAVQDALVSACEHLSDFEGRSRLSTWLTSIVINAARLQIRRRRPASAWLEPQSSSENLQMAIAETLPDERPGPHEIFAGAELYRLVAELMTTLSPPLRKTIRHYYIDGMTLAEVADTLDIPIGTAKARISRARYRLKQALHARTVSRLAHNSPMKRSVDLNATRAFLSSARCLPVE